MLSRSLSCCVVLSALFALIDGPGFSAETPSRTDLKDFDAFVANSMKAFQVPGAAVAVVKDGEIVLAKGYGFGTPASSFR